MQIGNLARKKEDYYRRVVKIIRKIRIRKKQLICWTIF